MPITRKRFVLGLLALLGVGVAAIWPARAGRSTALTIATWNLEWLVSPATAHASRLACRSGRRAALPCDVVRDLSRDSADLARLASYARRLDADVVAFQEVENEAIASAVFRGYTICMADGPGVQHVGFAVRPHLAHRCGPPEESLSMGGRSRQGMSLLLKRAGSVPVELLVVHLKSGCSRDPLDSGLAACRMLQQQSENLGEWIASRQTPFIVLGDFNRVPPHDDYDPFWQQVQRAPSTLVATRLPFSNCFAGQPYSQYIDHVLVSRSLLESVVAESPAHFAYRNADVVRYRLSDHCPVSISLNPVEVT